MMPRGPMMIEHRLTERMIAMIAMIAVIGPKGTA